MSFLGSNKVSSNLTQIQDDHRTQDNKVAAQDSTVVTTAGGAFTDSSGSISSAGPLTINTSDAGSYAFASDLVRSTLGANASSVANAAQATTKALDTVAQLTAGQDIGGNAGASWKKWAAIGGAAAAAIAAGWFLLRKRK